MNGYSSIFQERLEERKREIAKRKYDQRVAAANLSGELGTNPCCEIVLDNPARECIIKNNTFPSHKTKLALWAL